MEKEIGKLIFYRYKGNNKFQSCGEIESTHEFEICGGKSDGKLEQN